MKNILVLTDFSEVAYNASLFAMNMARQTEAEIHFLHVIYTSISWDHLIWMDNLDASGMKEQVENSKAELASLTAMVQDCGLKAKNFISYFYRVW